MLVLTRRENEAVVVPQCHLTVTVLEITASRVRLGISAPRGVAVHRREVWQQDLIEASRDNGGTLMSVRVLIADPNEFLAESYCEDLARRGAVATIARSALECVEKLREFLPDVLVLEPAIPWGGGDGVLAVMQEHPELRPAVVLLLTQAQDRGLLHQVARFRIDDFQVKPVPAKRLSERISAILARREHDGGTGAQGKGERGSHRRHGPIARAREIEEVVAWNS
jgi:carbon storage regulator